MKSNVVERVFAGILLLIGFGIVLHTPITVYLSTQMPGSELYIKAWKEVLMGIALTLLIYSTLRRKILRQLLADRIIQLLLVYAALHFILSLVIPSQLDAVGAGLLMDLRYLLYFVLVYGATRLFPAFRGAMLEAFYAGAAIVLGFALLQMFILPKDVLSNIGYSKSTISPYLTVDDNPEYVRINSTLRGPNPLGAYAVIIFAMVVSFAVKYRQKLRDNHHWGIGLSVATATLMIAVSYSRSALIALLATIVTIMGTLTKAGSRRRIFVGSALVAIIVVVLSVVARTNPVISHIIWHDDPNGGARVDSNKGHADSLVDGTTRMIEQPFGGGIGSTGSASLLSDKPLIIENQYLFIAHEVGWLGLGLFLAIFALVMRRLWVRRQGALALGVFASGVGLAIIGLLLPVWVDDTVSIIWWGLAGLALGGVYNARKNV